MTDIETARQEREARQAARGLSQKLRSRYERLRAEGWSAYTSMQIIASEV